jgi:hypothetical protein
VRPKEVLKNMRPVDMTPAEREEVEKEAEEVWTWIASLAIAAGIKPDQPACDAHPH